MPCTKCADPNLEYEVTSDASDTGTGAVLTQTNETDVKPIAYTSRKLSSTEQNYSTTWEGTSSNNSALTNLEIVSSWSEFTILTDHHPLKYLDTQKTLSKKTSKMGRIHARIQLYN